MIARILSRMKARRMQTHLVAEHDEAQRVFLRAKVKRDRRGMGHALPRLQAALAAKLEGEVRCTARGWRGSR